jgi:diguanylate cyclase (GGDEF)-like protein
LLLMLLSAAAIGALATWVAMRRMRASTDGERTQVTRLDAHLSASSVGRPTPATSTALRRDVQQRFEAREASFDLEMLDRLLRDIRDLAGADETIFWRWVEARQALVPSSWSTDGQTRPAFFDVRAWGPLVKWSAEEQVVQLAGDISGMPQLAVAPVATDIGIRGVLTISAASGLRLDRDAAKEWASRFAGQVASLVRLFELRRDYGRHMRRSEALLDAVRRFQGHRSTETLAQAISNTAHDITSASLAGLVRWSAGDRHGVVQAVSPGGEVEPGFHVTADTLVGRACIEGTPLLLSTGGNGLADACPYGGLARPVGSVAIIPIASTDHIIGAIVVEGASPEDISQHEVRNLGLLAAVARGPLEVAWEIEEVSRRARTDALTGLANRRHLDEQLRRVVAETDRFGGTSSLILIDLDHFKAINDKYGHDAGDIVLRHVAQLLLDAVRTVDLCARYGGEEIAVLLPQTSQAGALELAERLRSLLESRPVVLRGGERIEVTASFGVATYPAPVPSGDWLLPAADKALYEAKASGRNCVRAISASDVTPELYKAR